MLRPFAVRAMRATNVNLLRRGIAVLVTGRSVGFLQRLANILFETNCGADFVLPCRQHATGALS